ncbi:MAG TPA: hypothetical protein VFC18_10870 [Burkholderiales bacterium]|nr:hypothetical protein [Burkholderiales bacterium]
MKILGISLAVALVAGFAAPVALAQAPKDTKEAAPAAGTPATMKEPAAAPAAESPPLAPVEAPVLRRVKAEQVGCVIKPVMTDDDLRRCGATPPKYD